MMTAMSRRSFLHASLLTGAFATVSCNHERPRPNILFIAADDMNTSLGCYGHPLVQSPHLDGLASRGVRFDRAYCQFPLCGPSRASLLTGRRPDRTQVLGNNIDFRDALPDTVTLPQFFKDNGWYTAREGKMFHMNVPTQVTLDRFQDAPSWSHSVSPGGPEADSEAQGGDSGRGSNGGMHWVRTADGKGQSDSNAAERALSFLEEHRSEPFFLGLGLLRPHLPFVAPGRFFDLYPLDQIPLPKNPANDLDDIPDAAKGVRPYLWWDMEQHRAGKLDEKGIRETRRGYYATTSFMDEQVGRVLAGLQQLGLADNTIVVFWGDHGWSLGEHTHWQKMSLMEESTRVPLIIAAPGKEGNGKTCRALVEFVDLYPTLAELCGLTPPDYVEGESMARLLDHPGQRFKRAAYTQIAYEGIRGLAVRTDQYRYIRWQGMGDGEELYDHSTDPGEFRNLVRAGTHAGAVEMHRQLAEDYDMHWGDGDPDA